MQTFAQTYLPSITKNQWKQGKFHSKLQANISNTYSFFGVDVVDEIQYAFFGN
jgi:hypothetical protein